VRLGDREVHVISTSLDGHLGLYAQLARLLSPDEAERAARFRFPLHERRYVVGRGLLRVVLSGYVACSPRDLVFRYNAFGKPYLDDVALAFNVSHAGGRMLIGVTPGFDVGVDIEAVRSEPLAEGVPEHFFSAREVEALFRLPESQRPSAFCTCWTRKEAFIKGHGEGLSLPLQDFDVTLTPGVPPRLLTTRFSADEAREWTLYDVRSSADASHAAALAVRARDACVIERGAHFSDNDIDT
jgi:4'-phosphopantetheinyl transferase